MWSTIPALILDQEYGLLWYAPWLLLALAALPLAWPGKRRELSLIILVCAVGGLMLVFWRWLQWDAGLHPSGTFSDLIAASVRSFPLALSEASSFRRGSGGASSGGRMGCGPQPCYLHQSHVALPPPPGHQPCAGLVE